VLLVECDTSNPVWKAYSKQQDGELIDLDEAAGWIRLVNPCVGLRDGVASRRDIWPPGRYESLAAR
jgi:hypothetical protein